MPPNQLASLFQLLLGGGQQPQAPSGQIDFSKVDPNTPIAGEDPYSPVAFLRALRNDPVGDRNKQWTMTGPGGGFDMAKEAGFFGPQPNAEAKLASQGPSAANQWAQAGMVDGIREPVFQQAMSQMLQQGPPQRPQAPAVVPFQPQPYQQVGTWMPGAPGFEELYSQGQPIARRPVRGNGMGSLLYR